MVAMPQRNHRKPSRPLQIIRQSTMRYYLSSSLSAYEKGMSAPEPRLLRFVSNLRASVVHHAATPEASSRILGESATDILNLS